MNYYRYTWDLLLLTITLTLFVEKISGEDLEKLLKNKDFLIKPSCKLIQDLYTVQGLDSSQFTYSTPSKGTDLKVCNKDSTCCKASAERNFGKTSEKLRTHAFHPIYGRLTNDFAQISDNFTQLVKEIMSRSEKTLDTMFRSTYGTYYENNTEVFTSLYKSLAQYMNGSELDLQTTMDSFFAKLHEKIFQFLAAPFSKFNKKYENCINENTNYARPFGDIQQKIAHQTKTSFMAARMFLHSLRKAMSIVQKLAEISLHEECSSAFMEMTQCQVCSGYPLQTPPCHNYCRNVIKGCFAYTIMIQPLWSEFITNLNKLAEQLEGPFSVEAVVEPLGVKISEAIMVFQNNKRNVTIKVEEKCGKPYSSLGRRKRRSIKTDNLALFFNVGGKKEKHVTPFESLLQDARSKLEMMRGVWIENSTNLCQGFAAPLNHSTCWNGNDLNGYTKPVVGNEFDDLFNKNPEVAGDENRASTNILNTNQKLAVLNLGIRQALRGDNSNFCTDCEDDNSDSNQEGSGGSGSGDDTDGSGSGSGEPDSSGEPDYTTLPPTTTIDPCHNSVDENCGKTKPDTNEGEETNNYSDGYGMVRAPEIIIVTSPPKGSAVSIIANTLLLACGVLLVVFL